jgi:uncharacterized protein YlxW (UPF0749 family)
VDHPPSRFSRPSGWSVAVPVVALAAGLLFATSSSTAQGNDLRGGEVSELRELIAERQRTGALQEQQLRELREQVETLTDQAAGRNGAVAAAQRAGEQGAVSAALVPLTDAGVRITLDDAPQKADGSRPNGATADDLVIHQSDVQAVVNALWAAGADGVAIMDRRLIATSAVRCVGNTLLLQGRPYSPPFVITAIVDADAARTQLAGSPQVQVFEQAVEAFGLTFAVEERSEVQLPEYDGSLEMQYATTG